MKKEYARFAAALLSAAVVFTASFPGNMAVKAAEETMETERVPYGFTPIYDIADLSAINSNLSGSYILMNDIDMSATAPGGEWDSGNGWAPIGSEKDEELFKGVLDGNGHYIKNMHIYGNVKSGIGVFASLGSGSVIKNLGIVDCDISVMGENGTRTHVGAVSGGIFFEHSRVSISNCFVTGTIECLSGSVLLGGIVGYNGGEDVSIENCYNAANLKTVDNVDNIGGLVAYEGDIELKNCYYAGMINGASKWSVIAGNGKETLLKEAQMKTQKAFLGFDFDETWFIDEVASYEYPQLQSCPQARVASCELTRQPDKLEYFCGEDMDVSGGIITVSYEDGIQSSRELEESMLSGYDMDEMGKQRVLVQYAGWSSSFEIKVKEIVAESLQLNYKECELQRNKTVDLEAVFEPDNVTNQDLEWETNNELVAKVTGNGKVRGLNAGTAVITARTANGLTAKCTVVVKVPAKKLKLSVVKLNLKKGKTKKIKAVMTPLDSTDSITWLSSNSKIVKVNRDGVVTARKQGRAVVMAKTTSGISKKITVYVK